MTAPEPAVDPVFAHRAIALRVEQRWSVTELAARAGLAAEAVNRIEVGRREVTEAEAEALAAAFGETVASMVGAR